MKKRILLLCALLVSVITLSGAVNRSFRTEMEQWNPIGFTQAQGSPQTTNRLTESRAILPNLTTSEPSGELRGGSTNVITFTTAKAVGETVVFYMKYTGAVPTLTGLTGTPVNGEKVTYKLTSQTVTITGDVTYFACRGNQLTALDVSNNTALTELSCSENQLTALDVSKNTELTYFGCPNNPLRALDVSKNTALTDLICDNNQLTELDLSQNSALRKLACNFNQLKALDLSKNTALTLLSCYRNQLTVLNLPKNTNLEGLYCSNNQLKALDLSTNTKLKKIDCHDNQLSALDVSPLNELVELSCYGNQIEGKEMTRLINSLPDLSDKDAGTIIVIQEPFSEGNVCLKSDVAIAKDKQWITYLFDNRAQQISYYEGANATFFTTAKAIGETVKLKINYTGPVSISGLSGTPRRGVYVTYTLTEPTVTIAGNVTDLSCENNKLTALDLSQNLMLKELECSNNQLTALNVFQNFALVHLYCSNNQLTALDLSNKTALTWLACNQNKLTTLDISKNTELTDLNCSENQLTTLNISKNTALKELHCTYNQLTTLDLSQNTALETLDCSINKLIALDVSPNSVLTKLDCSNNQLTKLDLSQNSALTELRCNYNQLTALDLSKNTALTNLWCSYNQLKALDLSKNTVLSDLRCSGNQLTELDVSKNTGLGDIYCAKNKLTTLDLSQNHALYWLECYDNQIKGEEMTRVVNSLPDRKGKDYGTFVVIQDPEPEGNVCLKSDVVIAQGKKWFVQKYNTDDAQFVFYEGEEPITYAVTLTKEGEGTLTATGAGDLKAVREGTELTIEATPADGYELTALTANGADILATKKFVVTGATEVKATFTKIYAVTLTKEGEGTLSATGADNLKAVPEGTELTIEATPADGYELKALTANDTDILATKKFVVTAATEVKATFTKKTAAEVVESSSVRLYPNPASAYVNVKGAKADALVRLYDANGSLRYEARTDADGTLQIDLSAYAEGTYLLRVGDDAQRLLIQR